MVTKGRIFSIVIIAILIIFVSCRDTHMDDPPQDEKLNVLIFSKTNAFRHECIEPGGKALQNYFSSRDIASTFTEDSSIFSGNGLKPFDVIMFFQTTGNVLDSAQQQSMMDHVRSGKGFVGIHAASDTEYDWSWYTGLVGAQFASHPDIQSATIVKVDTHHITCKHLPERWMRTDEWYNFRQVPQNVNVLLSIDETTYQGGEHGDDHPISWNHSYDGGRSFYTALGHTVESYQDTLFLEHVLQGVIWVSEKF